MIAIYVCGLKYVRFIIFEQQTEQYTIAIYICRLKKVYPITF